jgi:site-specific DNA-cytosine methylase
MSQPTFVDCNGLAGFMSYGFVKSGMKMLDRTGTLDFGNRVAEANRHLLGKDWTAFFSDDVSEWPVHNADVVLGCPPCSGWSVWSIGSRGPDAAVHEHTRAFMRYAAAVKPKIIVFECVQQAFTQGRAVMAKYRDMVEELSGKEYDLYHVKMNNLQVGGFSYRARYFWVAAERGLPFGAHAQAPAELPKVRDIIGDLAPLELMWESQNYIGQPSKYVEKLRSETGKVSGHQNKNNPDTQRISEIFDILGNDGWPAMMTIDYALKSAVEKNQDKFPQSWQFKEEKLRATDFSMGFSIPCRWDGDSYCHVLTGGALDHVIHPDLPRRITHREAARIQGLPDDWEFTSVKDYSMLGATWGKAVSAQAATWIGEATAAALNGEPNGPQGELIGDREYLIDTDKGFTRHSVKKNWYNQS